MCRSLPKVLILDVDLYFTGSLKRSLNLKGIDVVICQRADQALKLLKEEKIALLVIDFFSGESFLKKFAENPSPSINRPPFILTSSIQEYKKISHHIHQLAKPIAYHQKPLHLLYFSDEGMPTAPIRKERRPFSQMGCFSP